jgi:PAS domain S-box-containing protein
LRRKNESNQLKASLSQSEGMLQSLVKTIPDLVWLKDTNGVFLMCNIMFERYFGAKEAEIIGKTDYDFVDKNLADFYRENDRKAMAAGKPSMNEEWISFADGKRALLETIKTPMFDKKGHLIGVLGIGHDITKRKITENILREKEEKFRALFEQAGDYSFILEYDKTRGFIIADANESSVKFHGFTRDEIIGKAITELDIEKDKETINEFFKRLWAGETIHFETTHKRKDGTAFPVEVTAKAVQLPDKTPIVLTTEHDITQRKKNEELLIREKEAAESADKLKSAFLATMSHELRTPLNSIIGFSGILLQGKAGPLTEEQKKQLGMIQSSGNHLLSLINDILDLSKIEAGQVSPKLEVLNLNEILEEIIKLTTPLAKNKGDSLILNSQESLEIITDRLRLRQIIFNLVDNAIKFTNKGFITINCNKEEKFAVIEVSDTGIGIKEEDQKKLFKPFIQIESYLARKHYGSGLGLSICKKLVELLGGTINVNSEQGKGSTFTVRLPISEKEL